MVRFIKKIRIINSRFANYYLWVFRHIPIATFWCYISIYDALYIGLWHNDSEIDYGDWCRSSVYAHI